MSTLSRFKETVNMSYYDDHRVRARKAYQGYNQDDMTLTVEYFNEEGDFVDARLPAILVRCDVCDGTGHHTNPSVDCDGISPNDEDYSEEFMHDYVSGFYDVNCYCCEGRRMVPVIDRNYLNTEEQLRIYEAYLQEERERAEFEAMSAAERRMGA